MSRIRSARVGTTAVGVILAAALLGGVNYLGARHWWRGDWTRTRIYSLSETSKKVLAGLSKPVRITVFMRRGSRLYQPVVELLQRYRAASPRLEVEILDPERNPARARALVQEFGIRDETVVFRSGERKKYVPGDKLADYDYSGMGGMGGEPAIKAFKGEEAFTSAVLDVTEDRVTRVYFSSGHGESSLDSQERGRGFAQVKAMLVRDNVTVASWDSLKGTVPQDATVLVVAGPKTALLEPEVAALEKYLAAGGRVMVMLDPVLPTPGSPPSDLGLGGLLASYGVRVNADLVIDPANAVPMVGPETVIANRYGTHPIVQSLSAGELPVLFPIARSVSKLEKTPENLTSTALVETTANGWGETSLSNLEEDVKKDGQDNAGPLSLAIAVEPSSGKDPKKAGPSFRLVLVGNSGFIANQGLGTAGNANLFLNAVHWLAGQEKLIGIAPKTPEQTSLSLTQSQVNRLGLLTVLGFPAFAVVLGVWVWYRRRD